MRIHELTIDECLAFLAARSVGRLGVARFDQPYVVPIHYAFDVERRCAYAFSAIGQKVEWMRSNPAVCLEVDEVGDKDHWTSVVLLGRYSEIGRTAEDAAERQHCERLLERRDEWWLPAAARPAQHELSGVVLYRIEADRLTGRRASRAAAQ